MIKKPWGAQSDDGREGMMLPNQKTSWHKHSKRTRLFAEGLMYALVQVGGGLIVRLIPSGGLSIDEDCPHCLFSCGESVMFRESGTEISKDITRLPWPNWADKIISGVRDSHRGNVEDALTFQTMGGPVTFIGDELKELPIEGYGRRDVHGVTNNSDVTTLK
jgi:hypothetical protein